MPLILNYYSIIILTNREKRLSNGIVLNRNQAIKISANGKINFGGPSSNFNGNSGWINQNIAVGSLMGKISTITFKIGSNFQELAPADGELYLRIHDAPGTYGNNSGSYNLEIQLTKVIL